ncbi:hypothetical protein NDA16_000485 [Ustilago loliicola]|nr:hypothetical protein NDA16_000485 [Ustilago loliicola]
MAAAIPIESTRIRPGQYSRHHSDYSSNSGPQHGKENQPLSPRQPQHDRGRSHGTSSSAQPIAKDPKYRLRGNSPDDAERASRSKFSSSSPTKKGLRSRSHSRSRLFGKDKTDSLNNQAVAAPAYDASTKTPEQIDADFLNMLDELQVQPGLRRKLLLLTSTVKASMLQGQATLSLASFGLDDTLSSSPTKVSRMPIPELLKGRPTNASSRPTSTIYQSSSILDQASTDDTEMMAPPNTAQLFGAGPPRQVSAGSIDSSSSHSASNSGSGSNIKQSSGSASRSALREAFKKSTPNLGQGGSFISLANSVASGSSSTFTSTSSRPRSMSFGKEIAASLGKETPESFATMLKCTDASRIDIARIKRMRAVLAAESPAWISTFIGTECGGYDAMLARLDELLAMEWRDEQHDDMLLHELLRCFVALSTTEVGRQALASQAPRPFRELVDLLFSEKRPGDLSTRKLMIELLAILLDLQLPASQSHTQSSLNYLLQLLQNPSDPAKESVVDFIKQTHTSRPFKTYVVELGTICRDYFWIFCHSQNRYWRFEELQDRIDSIRGPKVPGGMTGGVEFEAMSYISVHLRLINSIATILSQVKAHQLPRPAMTAVEFHDALFKSGIERVSNAIRASQSPTKGRDSPKKQHSTEEVDDGYWDFDSVPITSNAPAKFHADAEEKREVEVVDFDRRLDSQFSLTSPDLANFEETSPGVGMPSSTSKRILGLNEAVSQDLTNTVHHQNTKLAAVGKGLGGASVVGSAVKKWESMSISRISHHPTAQNQNQNQGQGRANPSHLR